MWKGQEALFRGVAQTGSLSQMWPPISPPPPLFFLPPWIRVTQTFHVVTRPLVPWSHPCLPLGSRPSRCPHPPASAILPKPEQMGPHSAFCPQAWMGNEGLFLSLAVQSHLCPGGSGAGGGGKGGVGR